MGSHNLRFMGWDTKYRWQYDEMEALYNESSIHHFTGTVGDVIVADTTGFHRGTKVVSSERHMLTVNYQVAPESTGLPHVLKADIERLPANRKFLADFLNQTDHKVQSG